MRSSKTRTKRSARAKAPRPELSRDFVTLARVVRPQGRVGEVLAEILTDFPERFAERKRLFLLPPEGARGSAASSLPERREMQLEDHWLHKGHIVLKFAGVDSISDAEAIVGCEVQIPSSERTELESGAYYVGDLVGCVVVDRGREVGKVADVNLTAGTAPLLIVEHEGGEIEIPFAEAYLKSVDTAGRRIEMELPEGLLEINAPLNAEEKRLQQRPS